MAKILLVDDEIDLIGLLQIRLESNGYEIISANDGNQGLKKARNEKPDLIILDIMMPRMDGFALLKEIRQDENLKDVPIIMCSGMDREKAETKCINAGANAYIGKPVESPILINTIEELLKNRS